MSEISNQKVLVFSSHAVDFVWRCGGTIARYTKEGAPVRVIDLTFGERGESAELWNTRKGITVQEVKEIRRKEAEKAAGILGAEIRFMDWDDHPLIFDKERLLKLVELLREFQPDVVLTHHSSDPLNLDHPETSRAIVWALRCAQVPGVMPGTKPTGRVKMCMFEPDQPEFCDFKPDTFIDITDVIDRKQEAMSVVASQTYLVENYTARAQYRGYLAQRISGNKNVKYAEAFVRFEPYVGRQFV